MCGSHGSVEEILAFNRQPGPESAGADADLLRLLEDLDAGKAAVDEVGPAYVIADEVLEQLTGLLLGDLLEEVSESDFRTSGDCWRWSGRKGGHPVLGS